MSSAVSQNSSETLDGGLGLSGPQLLFSEVNRKVEKGCDRNLQN